MTRDLDPNLDLRIDRVIRAPRDRVWAAWTDPLELARCGCRPRCTAGSTASTWPPGAPSSPR